MNRKRIGILCAVLMGAGAAIGRAQAPPEDPKAVNGPDFGPSTTLYQAIPASEFDPDTACAAGCTDYTSTWNPSQNVYAYRRYVTGGQPRLFASPRLPGGALLTRLIYGFCDNGGSGRLFFNVYFCNNLGDCANPPYHTYTTIAGQGCGLTEFLLNPHTVNNAVEKILVEVGWGVSDDTLQLAGVTFGYTLQVSPAPASPTFGDVQVSDAGFQYIEALVRSGITAGCGGSNYCPDDPLTRRQMAVFLAKALGLNWNQ